MRALGLTLLVFAVYVLSPVVTSFDSRWSIYLALSLVREGDLDLDEYAELVRQENNYAIRFYDGSIHSFYPYGTPLVAAPIVLLVDRVVAPAAGIDFGVSVMTRRPSVLEHWIASLVCAAAAGLMYFVARARGHGWRVAAGALLLFAFATPMWSTASRALWQHGPSALVLAGALLVAARAEAGRGARWLWLLGPLLAFGLLIRPTGAIPTALFGLYVLARHPRQALPCGLGGLAVLVPSFLYNQATYHQWLHPYVNEGRIGANPHVLEAMAANLVSPARGLLVFSPVLVFAAVGVWQRLRAGRPDVLESLAVAAILLHWIAVALPFANWWAGFSYGPRLFAETMPLFTLLLLPAMARLRGSTAVLFAVVALWSVFVHFRGATDFDTILWNPQPVSVDQNPWRVWDWRDPQFLRGLG